MERGKSSAVVVVVPRHIEVETQYVCIGSSISNDNVFEKVHTNTTWRPCFLLKYFLAHPMTMSVQSMGWILVLGVHLPRFCLARAIGPPFLCSN